MLDLEIAGPPAFLVVVALANAWLGMALGLLVSAFAATEFQAVQFLPAFVLPQFFLCGLLVPRDDLPDILSAVSDALPLSYAVDAMHAVAAEPTLTAGAFRDVGIVLGAALLALALGAATLRRRTA